MSGFPSIIAICVWKAGSPENVISDGHTKIKKYIKNILTFLNLSRFDGSVENGNIINDNSSDVIVSVNATFVKIDIALPKLI